MKGTQWNESETKKIFKAMPGSEALMEYLERRLDTEGLVTESNERLFPKKAQGCMVYKRDTRILLTSAPRKRDNYIHVVLTFGKISAAQLSDRKLKVGSGSGKGQDVKLYSNRDIDIIISLIQETMSGTTIDSSASSDIIDLPDWVEKYLSDSKRQKWNKTLDSARNDFIDNFIELEQLQSGKLALGDFKKQLDIKAKQKTDGINIWGFSGFSGQMFFNQLFNQAEHVGAIDEMTVALLDAITLTEQSNENFEEWSKEKLATFIQQINNIKTRATAKGYSPQKCANTNFAPFFLSFFWGLQNIHEHPIFYKASRGGLEILGYWSQPDDQLSSVEQYGRFLHQTQSLVQEIEEITSERWDMQQLEHFLYYIQEEFTEDEESNDISSAPVVQPQPLSDEITDLLKRFGYSVSQVSSLTEWEPTVGQIPENVVIWKYDCTRRQDLNSFVFLWEKNPDVFHAQIHDENEEGKTRFLLEIEESQPSDFLIRFEQYLSSAISTVAYTLDDAQKETYLNQELLQEWLDLLTDRRQIIFYGPPGTGKTFVAQRLAKVLAQQEQRIRLVQFHPSYTYEEFIEGLRPEVISQSGGPSQLNVTVKSGIFVELCREAARSENRDRPYILIIDEINRANTAKVFGELLFALEYRGASIELPYSRKRFSIPENVYVIGTMNTTDRSLAQIDLALRRRFQFIQFSAKVTEQVLSRFLAQHAPEMQGVAQLLKDVNATIGSSDLAIGHSYFMKPELKLASLEKIWKYQIIPYLEEVFIMEPERINDYKLESLLAKSEYFV
ncbi:McrB family protein [Paenibacillus sabinae]|uniref:ATPase n=1 Tax=Paenibacillus sabinae T27 TaxID=1268072 RepID=X4ZFR9_9BACL|nr:AAA family ATPase [Paenibacillus sabinae]AHV95615.1 ATPase [Paenibacillus sabinae T27]